MKLTILSAPREFIGHSFAGNGCPSLVVINHFPASDRYLVQSRLSRYPMHGAIVRLAILDALKPVNVQAALETIKATDAAFVQARKAHLDACKALLAFAPIAKGDSLTHERYGATIVDSVAVKPSPEHGALWEITACPILKSGKPGARKVAWMLKIA